MSREYFFHLQIHINLVNFIRSAAYAVLKKKCVNVEECDNFHQYCNYWHKRK